MIGNIKEDIRSSMCDSNHKTWLLYCNTRSLKIFFQNTTLLSEYINELDVVASLMVSVITYFHNVYLSSIDLQSYMASFY